MNEERNPFPIKSSVNKKRKMMKDPCTNFIKRSVKKKGEIRKNAKMLRRISENIQPAISIG